MDREKRRELMESYKSRHPEMGVVAIRCTATGDVFVGASKDTKADINSNRFKLASGSHRNRELAQLWSRYGPDAFEFYVESVLDYDDPEEDHGEELEALVVQALAKYNAKRIWR